MFDQVNPNDANRDDSTKGAENIVEPAIINTISGKIVLNDQIVLAINETMNWTKDDFLQRIQPVG